MTSQTQTLPKAAKRLIDDARVAGFDVTAYQWEGGLDVHIESAPSGASVYWTNQSTGSLNSRLGFATSVSNQSLRFGHASVRVDHRYPPVTTIREVREHLGLSA